MSESLRRSVRRLPQQAGLKVNWHVSSAVRWQLTRARFRSRSDHFVLSAYPKSGSTWLRMMVVTAATGSAPSFGSLRDLAPPLESSNEELAAGKVALLKTHDRPYRYFNPERLVYLVRDPVTVGSSLWEQVRREGWYNRTDEQFVKDYLAGRIGGLGPWNRHAESGMRASEAGALLLDYAHLQKDPVSDLSDVLAFIGIEAAIEISDAVEMNDRTSMRRREVETPPAAGFATPLVRTGAMSASRQWVHDEIDRLMPADWRQLYSDVSS